jgi:hypothetical protein
MVIHQPTESTNLPERYKWRMEDGTSSGRREGLKR